MDLHSKRRSPGPPDTTRRAEPTAAGDRAGSSLPRLPLRFSARRQLVLICLLLFALVLGVFLPAILGGFIGLDDPFYVTLNFHVRSGFSRENLVWAFSNVEASNWHPVTWLSHMLDCELFGLDPRGHHLTSIVIHALNAVLVFLLFHRMTGALWRSLLLAALFGLHPFRVESVAWIAERKDVLSALFWLLTLLAYTKYSEAARGESPRPKLFYALSLAFFLLGLMSKPMVVTQPFVLLLLDYWPLRRFGQKRVPALVLEKVPFFLGAAAASIVTLLVQKNASALAVGLPFTARLGNALVSYCRYLGKLFYPSDLAIIYPHPDHWSITLVLLSAVLLLGLSAAAIAFRTTRPYLVVGWFWFLGTLVPVIGLVQVGGQAMADRYTYIPTLGILLLLIWGACDLTDRWRFQKAVFTVTAMALAIGCAMLARRQIGFWRTDEVLFRHALDIAENNYMAHYCLGFTLDEKGDVDGAISEYQKALKAHPAFADAHNGLGYALLQKGRLDEAIVEHQAAVRLEPGSPSAHYHLGIALDRKGLADEAISQYREALKLNPAFPDAHYLLGGALQRKGLADEALSHYQESVRLKPDDYPDAHNNLGVALGREGKQDEALLQFQVAARLRPDSAEIHYNFGNALIRKGRDDEAITQFVETLKLQPDHIEAHNNLGVALTRKRMLNEAISQFEAVLKLQPDNAEARKNLGIVLRMKSPAEKKP